MSEPWLSDLSEDWKSPSSAASSSLPNPKRTSISSRIPRPNLLKSVSALHSPSAAHPQSPKARQRVLSERSRSDINISSPRALRSSPPSAASANKLSSSRPPSRPSTVSASGSVVKRPSPTRKNATVASNQTSNPPTPEWKQQMQNVHNGHLAGNDLFAPNQLQNMFQKPPSPEPDESTLPQHLDSSILPNLPSMPSSPPPWPTDHPNFRQPLKHNSVIERSTTLGPVHEESYDNENDLEQDYSPHNFSSEPLPELEASLVRDSRPTAQYDGAPAPPEQDFRREGARPSAGRSSDSVRGSSVVSGSLSPVFISKHNIAGGGIGYAAMDPSNPDVLQQLRRSQDTSQQRPTAPSDATKSGSDLPNSMRNSSIAFYGASHSQFNRMSLPPISEFVNTERGAADENPSFLKRPLSPSASSSILPSESASQVRYEAVERKVSATDSVKTAVHNSELLPAHPDSDVSTNDPEVHSQLMQTENDHVPPTKSPERLFSREDMASMPGDNDCESDKEDQPDQERHKSSSAITGKRKDARYDDQHQLCDPEELARREILRPRNTIYPHAHTRSSSKSIELSRVETGSTLDVVQRHIQDASVDVSMLDEGQIKALVTEVASMQLHEVEHRGRTIRKPSVSTQDYLNDAMKIMELIRSKRKPQSELASLQESEMAYPEHEFGNDHTNPSDQMTPQDISRPPSREGAVSAWRTGNSVPINAAVASHLEKYQETEDESFMATSAFGHPQDSELAVDQSLDNIALDEQSVGIRILAHHQRDEDDYHEELKTETSNDSQGYPSAHVQSPLKTQSSTRSTDSSARTQETTSSQKTTTLAVIGPDKVSHLIRSEEAGMRFDSQRKVWVKCKDWGSKTNSIPNESGSDGTEDPFHNIPDLSINEEREPLSDSQELVDSPTENERQPFGQGSEQEQDQSDLGALGNISFASNGPFENAEEDISNVDPVILEQDVDNNFPSEALPHLDFSKSLQKPSKGRSATEPGKRREVSVLFSSPPVTKSYEAQYWSNSSSQFNSPIAENDHDPERMWRSPQPSTAVVGSSSGNGLHHQASNFNPFGRELSISCIDEHHEVSFVGTRPDGRTMSLTLSISTPLPGHRQVSRPVINSSNRRSSGLWNSLSPLSDFSVHQDDAKQLKTRQLSLAENRIIPVDKNAKPAAIVQSLVQKLTDVEPDEPYWDFMRALHLTAKDLSSLHMLDEFCPRIEELDVSGNRLEHLTGAPINVRQLTVKNNQLSSLSRWDHLANLQYLDISGNNVERLDGFSSLIHLRELKADDNVISELDGIFDLDGLLHISLKRNKLQVLDFCGSDLKRLRTVDVESNPIQRIKSLDSLPALEEIKLTHNRLICFPSSDARGPACLQTRSLCLANNQLEAVDLTQFPNLQYLNVDENKLVKIENVDESRQLQTLSARSQKVTPTKNQRSIAEQLNEFSEIQHLYLSGNAIPELRLEVQMFNLQTLELAFAGVHSLPPDLASQAPNLRTLNLNSNGITDLRPLRGIQKMQKLFLASNRLSRLRKSVRVLNSLPSLVELDLRDNPLTLGFYPSILSALTRSSQEPIRVENIRETANQGLKHLVPRISSDDGDAEDDKLHLARLDEDTLLRRRVYELLMAAKLPALDSLDGRRFRKDSVFAPDETWNRLMKIGVVEKAEEYSGNGDIDASMKGYCSIETN